MRTGTARHAIGIVTGALAAVAVGVIATLLAERLWPAYAAARPTKSYTLAMLVTRLAAGALAAAVGAFVTTRLARDDGRAAWWLGGLFLAVSLPDHLFLVWQDYPAWYHVVYLTYLVPVAGVAGTITARRASGGGAAAGRQSS